MTSAPPRVYAGRDAGARRADRRSRLTEAGLGLLATSGAQAVTVRGVCERAGLAARYFYESFADTDALLTAVFDGIIEELIGAGRQAIAAAPPGVRSRLRAGLGAAIDLCTADPRKGQAVLARSAGIPALTGPRLAANQWITRLVAAQMRADLGPAAGTDRQLHRAAGFVVGGVTETLTAWMHDPAGRSRDQLLDDCTELFLAATSAVTRLTP